MRRCFLHSNSNFMSKCLLKIEHSALNLMYIFIKTICVSDWVKIEQRAHTVTLHSTCPRKFQRTQFSEQAISTGKSLSEAFIFASTNPQYDSRLFIELPLQYMTIASSERSQNMLCTQIVFCFDIQNNLCTQHVLLMFWAWNFHVLTEYVT